jgi:hypothetical protein
MSSSKSTPVIEFVFHKITPNYDHFKLGDMFIFAHNSVLS